MMALTQRTGVLQRQDKKGTDHDALQQQPGIVRKGQRKILSGRSSWMGFCYNKSALVRWNRSAQVIEGMRWNHYRSCGKDTPFSSLREHEKPPIASGAMKSIDIICGRKGRAIEHKSGTVEALNQRHQPIANLNGGAGINDASHAPAQHQEARSDMDGPIETGRHEISGNGPAILESDRIATPKPDGCLRIAESPHLIPNPPSVQIEIDDAAPQKTPEAMPAPQIAPTSHIQRNDNPAHDAQITAPANIEGTPARIVAEIPAPLNLKAPPIPDPPEIFFAIAAHEERQEAKTVSALPMHEGPMASDPLAHRHSADQRGHGHSGSLRRKGIALKTAMASADPE
jgi:hypothetical protein